MAEEDNNNTQEQQPKVTPETLKVTEGILDKNTPTHEAVHPVIHDVLSSIAGKEVADKWAPAISQFIGPKLDAELPQIRQWHTAAKSLGIGVDSLGSLFGGGSKTGDKQVASNNIGSVLGGIGNLFGGGKSEDKKLASNDQGTKGGNKTA